MDDEKDANNSEKTRKKKKKKMENEISHNEKKRGGDRVKHIFKRVLAFWIMFNTTNLRIFPIGEGDAATPVTMKA